PMKSQLKCRSGCKASGRCPDPCFTCASWVKTSETLVWCRIDKFFTQSSVKHGGSSTIHESPHAFQRSLDGTTNT
ncbi:hypothetical protein HAX54_040514, partial [Datura stramonium]|nr:hypothetical protein [Datura stramonium]